MTLQEFKEQNRRNAIVGLGAIICLLLGMFGKTPGVTDFFSFCIGIVFTRWAFRV